MILPFIPYSSEYYPTKETIEFFVWLNTNFKEDNKSAPVHYRMIDHINNTETKFKGLMASRGISKTTLVGVYYIAYLLWKGRKPNVKKFRSAIYVMDTITKAKITLSRVINLIKERPDVFGSKLEIVKSNLGDDPQLQIFHKVEKRNMWYIARGTGQSLRGTNLEERPDIILFDDIESEVNAGTDEARMKNLIWFFANALPAGRMGDTEFIFIGTPIHRDAIIYVISDGDGKGKKKLVNMGIDERYIPEWHFLKLPVAEKFPVDNPDDIVSCWEDRFTPKVIMQTYVQYKLVGMEHLFMQEYMLELIGSGQAIYDMDKINWVDYVDIKKSFNDLVFYISIDLRAKKDTERATKKHDDTAIAVIAIHRNTGHWFLIDGVRDKLSVDEALEWIFKFNRLYKPISIVFEEVVFQTLFSYILNKEMVKRGEFLNFDTIKRTINKLSVFKQFSSVVNNNAFWIVKKEDDNIYNDFVNELIDNQMPNITKMAILSEHDDVLDSIAQLILANLYLPEVEVDDDKNNRDWVNPYLI